MPRSKILLQKNLPTRQRWRPRAYSFGFLYGGTKGSAVRHLVSMGSCKSGYALSGGMYVSASSWQDPPTAGPSSVFERILFAAK